MVYRRLAGECHELDLESLAVGIDMNNRPDMPIPRRSLGTGAVSTPDRVLESRLQPKFSVHIRRRQNSRNVPRSRSTTLPGSTETLIANADFARSTGERRLLWDA